MPQLIPLVIPRKIVFDQEDEATKEDQDEGDASGGLYSIVQYANFNHAWGWPLYHKTLRAWVNFREGKPAHLGKDASGELHPGLNTF